MSNIHRDVCQVFANCELQVYSKLVIEKHKLELKLEQKRQENCDILTINSILNNIRQIDNRLTQIAIILGAVNEFTILGDK